MDRALTGPAGGDYRVSRRRHHLQVVAVEYAGAGLWPDLLESLGRLADADSDFLDARLARARAGRARLHLKTLPAPERYEMLRAWTFPTSSRRSVRMLSAVLLGGRAAAGLRPSGRPATSACRPRAQGGLVSIPLLLIEAARESGRLDALAEAIKEPAEQKVENAESLALLVEIARGRDTPSSPGSRPCSNRSAGRPRLCPGSMSRGIRLPGMSTSSAVPPSSMTSWRRSAGR